MVKRIFTAVKIHPDQRFIETYNNIRSHLSEERITWVDINLMHLTLRFFGDTPEEEIPGIINALKEASFQTSPFAIKVANVGFFGKTREPKVIWVGIEDAKPLVNFELLVRKKLSMIGYQPENEVFKPHLTIGRIKQPVNTSNFINVMESFKNLEIKQEPISELVLFESKLRPQGPQYLVLSKMPLGN